jgi:hypothetical protein
LRNLDLTSTNAVGLGKNFDGDKAMGDGSVRFIWKSYINSVCMIKKSCHAELIGLYSLKSRKLYISLQQRLNADVVLMYGDSLKLLQLHIRRAGGKEETKENTLIDAC